MLIVDNHELVRRGLAALVNAEDDMVSCGEVACSEAALGVVQRVRPEVVLIDVSASRGAGLDVMQQIRRCDAGIRIVALAMNDKPELVEQILSAGAAAFVMKTDLAARVLDAIRRKRSGREEPEREAAARRPGSDRSLDRVELQIGEMIGRGIPTRAIAVRLGMSVAMVHAYRRRIRGKLGFPTATQLVEFCVRLIERNQALSGPQQAGGRDRDRGTL